MKESYLFFAPERHIHRNQICNTFHLAAQYLPYTGRTSGGKNELNSHNFQFLFEQENSCVFFLLRLLLSCIVPCSCEGLKKCYVIFLFLFKDAAGM